MIKIITHMFEAYTYKGETGLEPYIHIGYESVFMCVVDLKQAYDIPHP